MNIDELQAGRELDALVAERVMGWSAEEIKDTSNFYTADIKSGVTFLKPNPECKVTFRPSTDIGAAWQVWQKLINMDADYPSNFVEHLCGGEPEMHYQWDGFNVVCFVESVLKDITPLKICKAALFAMEKGP